ncbi:hypothetical protein CC86DRAFT_393295 [Ophiobolus disseminans]|uniref:C2H2-type domain-containing protein n=1 Tax=Ophiobolus disseminans TaxID=1469910 RepID=A0A6A7A4B3_9PLEO|nr:hypothetical protein CC86DRAFT_393295 [Ophiobolus disseminans]
MWSSRYRREESSDGFQLSPCLTASSALLTPPSSYGIDARRHLTASTLSSLGPATPIYGRNPFSNHSYVAVAAMDRNQDDSMDAIATAYSFKAPGPEDTSFGGWSTLAQAGGLDQSMPPRMHDPFASHPSLLQVNMARYPGVDDPMSSLPSSCATSFVSVPYTDFHDQMNDGTASHTNNEPAQPFWSYQYAIGNMMDPRTMAPFELLSGDYVHLNPADQDTDMGIYDDANVPLPPSPQEVIVKHEGLEMSEDEKQIRRSIHVSRIGGKTIPGTKRWRNRGSGPPDTWHYCRMEEDMKPCGKKFKREEHLRRNEKTHSGTKPFTYQICNRSFNRNDNFWEHYWTHVRRPGKKDGRNKKRSPRRVLTYITDPKYVEKLHNKWKNEVHHEYDPETEPVNEEEESSDDFPTPAVIKEDDERL